MAMTLEEAAHVAVLAVRSLVDTVGQARDHCRLVLDEVTAQSQRLAADRSELQQALDALEHTLDDLGQRIPQDASDAETALASLHQGAAEIGPVPPNVPGVQSTAADTIDVESEGLEQLAERVRQAGPSLEPIVTAAEAASQAALDRADAIEEALRQAMDDAEQMVSLRLAAGMAETRESLSERAEKVSAVLTAACPAFLDEREAQWDDRWSQAHQLLEKFFADMQQHAEALAEEVMEGCAARVVQVVEEAATASAAIEMGLLELGATLSRAGDCLNETPAFSSRLVAIATGARAAAEAVQATLERWCGFGFGC